MSKRFNPQQYGERKKAKLDISFSDHNFPLSQSTTSKDAVQANPWGDDNDDEMLLMASQACEEAIEHNDQNVSLLPNYSMCMQPSSTSTQFNPIPGTSKSSFSFKKPIASSISTISTNLKDKCGRISSPLPGLSKAFSVGDVNVSDDIILNGNFKDQNSDYMYRQLLQLQEENAKLKSENGKLLEKCVTKEGESSILRTQLKTCQMAMDNVRLEKIKAQEKAQMDWSEKLTAANNKLQDLRTQLDFKNLEVISMKEKCKMLESSKVKLTQVMIPANDITMSQRHNNSFHITNDTKVLTRKVKTTSNSAQTEDRSHFLTLNIPQSEEQSQLSQILPVIIEPTLNQCSLLDYNEKLKFQTNIQRKYRIFNTFHRLPATCSVNMRKRKEISVNSICQDLSYLSTCKDGGLQKYMNIFKTVIEMLNETQTELETISQRMTTAFQKEMDEKYIDSTSTMLLVDKRDLLLGRPLYKEEQGIPARRLLAALVYILEHSAHRDVRNKLFELENDANRHTHSIIRHINRICVLLDNTTCAILYSGLILSKTYLLHAMYKHIDKKHMLQIIKTIIISRPRLFVSCQILKLLSLASNDINSMCLNHASGNLKLDYDQGVLLYKKDSCALQVLLKQIEAAFKCTDRQRLRLAVDVTRSVIVLYNSLKYANTGSNDKNRCDCQLSFMQVMVYGLRICSSFMNNSKNDSKQADIQSVCLSGTCVLYQYVMRDVEFLSQLGDSEGHLLVLCEALRNRVPGDVYSNMLSEITSSLQSMEESPKSVYSKAWLGQLKALSLTE